MSSWPAVVYAVGDVHGCYDELLRLEALIQNDAADIDGERWIVMLGDYVDRGPSSSAVIDHLSGPAPAGFRRFTLAGNHEQMMLDYLTDPKPDSIWLHNGGMETLGSYRVDMDAFRQASPRRAASMVRSHVPADHIAFLRDLPVLMTLPGVALVHAGIHPARPVTEQYDEDLMWIREPFLSGSSEFQSYIVHGHTQVDLAAVIDRRVAIDTGAYATGILTAARLSPDGKVHFLDTRSAQG